MVEICHRKGLKCLLCWPWEDTRNVQCLLGRLTLEHPRLWDERADGYASPARLSLAYAEVPRYKAGLAHELLALGVDGLFIDYRRQSNWSPQFGYVRPALAAYREQVGYGDIDAPVTSPENGGEHCIVLPWQAARFRVC